MRTLTYNAAALHYEVAAKPLSDSDKERVCLIEDLNKIQKALGERPINVAQFELCMSEQIDQLRSLVWDKQATLNRHIYDNTKAPS